MTEQRTGEWGSIVPSGIKEEEEAALTPSSPSSPSFPPSSPHMYIMVLATFQVSGSSSESVTMNCVLLMFVMVMFGLPPVTFAIIVSLGNFTILQCLMFEFNI